MMRLFTLSVLVLNLSNIINASNLLLPESSNPEKRLNGLLEVIGVEVPPRENYENPSCRQALMVHEFANTYGIPFVGTYNPPTNCIFTTILFNLTVTSSGHQYDRLALLFFGSTELWRTSTAMPISSGIYWTTIKDMTIYSSLLHTTQKIIFDLNNIYDEEYTGIYNVTLEALYYDDEYVNGLTPADMILPISALASEQNISSVLSLPDDNGSIPITFPPNTRTAVVSILASGNSAEEFWYTNVPSEFVDTFEDNEGWLYGYSPFREIQLYIDGVMAGVEWPFPVLFSGGVDPGLWRPVVGIGAYDLPSFEIDLTPWLPLLCDGNPHNFSLEVVGYDSSIPGNIGTVGENWYITARVFIWLDEAGNQTTGSAIQTHFPPPTFTFNPHLNTLNTTTNTSLSFTLTAHRTLSLTSTIHTSSGPKNTSWTQSLSFQNIQNIRNSGYNQSLSQVTISNFSSSSTTSPYTSSLQYPLNLYSSYIIAPTSTTLSSVFALIDLSLLSTTNDLLTTLSGISKGKKEINTRQKGESRYYWNETIVQGMDMDRGEMEQWFSFQGGSGVEGGVDAFSRYIWGVNEEVIVDDWGWVSLDIPRTESLIAVEGEPTV